MLAKCWSTKVIDFLLDLRLSDPQLQNVKFLEQHQLFHDPNTEYRAGQVFNEAYVSIKWLTLVFCSFGH